MPVTIDNISRLLERIQIRQIEGNHTLLNIKNGFDSFKITKGTDVVKFEENYNFCIFLGLIIIEKENLTITELGKRFLEKIDLDSKKKFLRATCVKENEVSKIIFFIINNFNSKNKIYSCQMDLISKYFKNYENWIDLLYEIDFWKKNHSFNIVEINSEISGTSEFERLMFQSKIIQDRQRKHIPLVKQEEDRKKEEERNKITGQTAEEIVVKYEKKRLEIEGFHDEADKVRQISVEDSTAGYDVESFFGKASDLTKPDKLIEVKGTTTNEFGFFWSKNEIKAAQKYGQNYWIYVVTNIDNLEKTGSITEKIQNPSEKIFNDVSFKTEIEKYHITKID